MRLFVVADSGELFRIGSIRTAGLQRFDEEAMIPTARELIGKPATEQLIRDVQDRLLSLGLFESIIIEVDANSADPAKAQALLALRELPLQQATVGVGYADDTGLQATLEHTHRRIFDTRWVMHNRFQVGQEQSMWTGDLMSHLQEDGYRNLLAGQAEKLTTNDETRYSWYARAGPDARHPAHLAADLRRIHACAAARPRPATTTARRLSANYHWTWRDVDDLRTPTLRQRLVAAGRRRPGPRHGHADRHAAWRPKTPAPSRALYGRVQGYLPLGNGFYGSARLELGQVFVQETLSVPDTLLFRAGGDDSVRGYAYRSLGPEVDGAVVSGSTLLHRPACRWPGRSSPTSRPSCGRCSSMPAMPPTAGTRCARCWATASACTGAARSGRCGWTWPMAKKMRKFRLHFSVGVVF